MNHCQRINKGTACENRNKDDVSWLNIKLAWVSPIRLKWTRTQRHLCCDAFTTELTVAHIEAALDELVSTYWTAVSTELNGGGPTGVTEASECKMGSNRDKWSSSLIVANIVACLDTKRFQSTRESSPDETKRGSHRIKHGEPVNKKTTKN